IRRVGSGAMGEVFEAYDCDHDTHVALKLLSALTPEAPLRFKNEFRSLHDLEHPNVVSFGELLEEGGRWFFTMEFVDGTDFLSFVQLKAERALAEDEQPTVATRSVADADTGRTSHGPPIKFCEP